MLPRRVANDFMEAMENFTRLLENLSLMPRVKENYECYKLKFMVPGLRKEDINIPVQDGVFEDDGTSRKKEAADGGKGGGAGGEESDDDEHPGISHYLASVLVPEDTKVDGVKAELKDGVLTIVMPRDEEEKKKKHATEIKIQ